MSPSATDWAHLAAATRAIALLVTPALAIHWLLAVSGNGTLIMQRHRKLLVLWPALISLRDWQLCNWYALGRREVAAQDAERSRHLLWLLVVAPPFDEPAEIDDQPVTRRTNGRNR